MNVETLPKAKQRTCLTTFKIKEAEATISTHFPAPSQPADAPADESSNSPLSLDTKYCALCTPLGKLCPNEFPVSQDWEEDSKEEEGNDQDKGKGNFSACLDWDTNFKEQDRQYQEIKDQRTMKGRHPGMAPHSCQLLHAFFSHLQILH